MVATEWRASFLKHLEAKLMQLHIKPDLKQIFVTARKAWLNQQDTQPIKAINQCTLAAELNRMVSDLQWKVSTSLGG
eukprot:11570197-Ditylum_brightwellii.AAC.1